MHTIFSEVFKDKPTPRYLTIYSLQSILPNATLQSHLASFLHLLLPSKSPFAFTSTNSNLYRLALALFALDVAAH